MVFVISPGVVCISPISGKKNLLGREVYFGKPLFLKKFVGRVYFCKPV